MAENTPKAEGEDNPDVHFEPIVKLPEYEVKTLEDEEDVLLKLRAKLFRYDSTAEPAEWKERGVGDVKILKHKAKGTCRILMRRDKTFKVCANHYVTKDIKLTPNCGSDRAWVWNTLCDFADDEPKPELLAIRFANAENAQKFKTALEEAQELIAKLPNSPAQGDSKVGDTKEETSESSKSEAAQSGGDAAPQSKENGENTAATNIVKDDKNDQETDTVADKLGALSVGETKSEEVKTDATVENQGSPEAER